MGSVVTHTYTALILTYMLHDLVIYFQNNALGKHIVVPRLHPIYCKEILYTKEPLWPTLKIPDVFVPMLLFFVLFLLCWIQDEHIKESKTHILWETVLR